MLLTRIPVPALALLLLLPLPALAEDDDAEADGGDTTSTQAAKPRAEPEYVEVDVPYAPSSNTIASKLPLPLQLTPANVGSVSEALFREQDGYVLSDALRNVSGLNVQAQGGVHDYFMIRGYDSISSGLVLTDGAIEPESTWYPLYNLAGVEVLKGPSGFLYGVDPLAGVVNLVRKQPVPSNFANLGLSLGSFSTAEATVDWNLASSDATKNFRLNALGFTTENYRDIGESEQVALNPSFTWQIGDKSSLNFNLEYVSAQFQPDSGLPLVGEQVPPVPRERSYQTPFDFSDQDIYRFQVDYETPLSEKITLRNKFFYRSLDWNTLGTQIAGIDPFAPPGSVLVARQQFKLDDTQRFTGNQLEAVYDLATGPVTHNLLTGLELRYLTDDFDIGFVPQANPFLPPDATLPSIDLFNPVETATPVTPIPSLVGDSNSTVVAPYVTDQMTFSKKFQLLIGARYDSISRDDVRTVGPMGTPQKISRDDTKVSPMLGLLYAPDTSLSIYANAAQSFAPAGVRVIGELDPEESTGYELGLKKRFFDGKMRTTFAVYQLARENLAISDDNGVTEQPGDQRSRGFEVELAAEPLTRFRTFLAYAYTEAEFTDFTRFKIDPFTGQPGLTPDPLTGNTPAFVPKNLVNLWVSKTLRGGLGFGGGARYIGDQYVSATNAAQIDAALVFDATVFYNFKHARASINFKNLTDEEYEVRGFGANSVIPAAPRAVYVGFEYRM